MDKRPTIWTSGLLHFVLVFGSLVFALPYFWLVGTSWKLDKEVQSELVTIFPQAPRPRLQSPYVDERQFRAVRAPEAVGAERWRTHVEPVVTAALMEAVQDWLAEGHRPQAAGIDREVLQQEIVEGLVLHLGSVLPAENWNADLAVLRAAINATVTRDVIDEIFGQCCRYFAIGKLLIKDRNYRIHDLTGQRSADEVWSVDTGPLVVEPRQEAGRSFAEVRYDFSKGDKGTLVGDFDLPVPPADLKRISLSFRRDQTWHELRADFEIEGRLLRSVAPKYLGEDTWWEVNYQEPSPDDRRLSARNYLLIEEADRGPAYDHGPGRMRVRVTLDKSNVPEALWAKGTENYREAFEQVPFWRYFKTSVFLVIANVFGTALSCSLVAFAFARLSWPGRDLCFILVLATMMIPPQITMIPSFVIYKYLGWYNTLAPLWVPNLLAVNAFAIFLLRQAMKGIPRDLEEAAQIDGCGWGRIYLTIALPLMRPTLAAISIFTFMFVWNDFMTPLIYVNDQRLYPLALGLFSFLAGRENQFTLIMAGSMIMTLPVILIFFVAQRHFIQGVTMTGMKN